MPLNNQIKTQNTSGGFFGTILAERGEAAANRAWASAFDSIARSQPTAKAENVRDYLDSEFGERTALQVLSGVGVVEQIQTRPARFLKHFKSIQRQQNAS